MVRIVGRSSVRGEDDGEHYQSFHGEHDHRHPARVIRAEPLLIKGQDLA